MSIPIGGPGGPGTTASMASADTFVIWRTANGDVRVISKADVLSGYQTGNITITGTGTLALSTYTLTVPATGTAALRGTAQTFAALQTFSSGVSFGQDTLNQYDEGTWTPADGSGAGLTFTGVAASYTRIGRMVFLRVSLEYPVTANGTVALITGLPYMPATVGTGANQWGGDVFATDADGLAADVDRLLYDSVGAGLRVTNTGRSNRTNAQLSGVLLRAQLWYHV